MEVRLPVMALALTILGMPAPAHAVTSPPIEHLTGAEMQALLQAWGYTSGELSTDDTGDPQIRFPMAGVHPYIAFYNCTKTSDTGSKTCQSIAISIGFSGKDLPTIAKVNEWNLNYRYSTAYLRDNVDPYLRYDILLTAAYLQLL
jgi:hypothetical protein